jgi:hypothetical protein
MATRKTTDIGTLTADEYGTLAGAAKFFNDKLGLRISAPFVITLARHANSRGHFAANKWRDRSTGKALKHELNLNPSTFVGRSDKEILSTLAHELVHCWQFEHGTPSRKGYHNAEWADQMEAVGLMPSHDGTAEGKRTGSRCTHYILKGGMFDQAADAFLKKSALQIEHAPAPKKDRAPVSKLKYSCPECGTNVWGKPDLSINCSNEDSGCDNVPMVAADAPQVAERTPKKSTPPVAKPIAVKVRFTKPETTQGNAKGPVFKDFRPAKRLAAAAKKPATLMEALDAKQAAQKALDALKFDTRSPEWKPAVAALKAAERVVSRLTNANVKAINAAKAAQMRPDLQAELTERLTGFAGRLARAA